MASVFTQDSLSDEVAGSKRTLKKTLSDEEGGLHLRYYIFDWDDNVVHMPTRIWMEGAQDGTKVPLTTGDYAIRRHEPGLRHPPDAFREFQDGTGDFESDLQRAMAGEKWKGPAFDSFKEAVMGGRQFAIVTARGHSETTMRIAIANFVNTILSDNEKEVMLQSLKEFKLTAKEDIDTDFVRDYFNLCQFVGVTCPDFQQGKQIKNVEEGKQCAIRLFVKSTVNMSQNVFAQRGLKIASISFGMSDDDHKNVQAIDKLMRDELSPQYKNVKFVVFDTGGSQIKRLKSYLYDPLPV